MESNNKDNRLPDWLKTLTLNSWEAELLISALLLYALFTVPDQLSFYVRRDFGDKTLIIALVNILTDGIGFIKLGFVLHILVRGIWISYVGLSYVFPEGINRKRLKFKDQFDKELENRESLETSILDVERISSAIYGISFMLFGVFVGSFLSIFVLVIAVEYLMYPALRNDDSLIFLFYILFIFIYVFSLLLVIIDFITNGGFRKASGFAKYYYPFSYFFRFLTLSFFYRKSILVLISNLKRWQSILLPFMIMLIIIGYNRGDRYLTQLRKDDYYKKSEKSINISNYENLRDPDNLLIATIPSDVITTKFFKLYLKDLKVLENLYERESERDIWLRWDDISEEERAIYVEKYIEITINNKALDETEWYSIKHEGDFYQGYATFISMINKNPGKKVLKIAYRKDQLNDRQKELIKKEEREFIARIIFYYAAS